jgi:hypothetical protein
MSLFHLPILDVLPQVVADGSQGWVHLHTEVTPKAYGCFVNRALLLKRNVSNIVSTALLSSPFSFNRIEMSEALYFYFPI